VTDHSILWDLSAGPRPALADAAPSFFTDLNLDQVVEAICLGRFDYELEPYFWTSLSSLQQIRYRHEVLRDLEQPWLHHAVRSFAAGMRTMRKQLSMAGRLHRYQRERWFLDAVLTYCEMVGTLGSELKRGGPASRGFRGLRDRLAAHAAADRLDALVAEAEQVRDGLAAIVYTMQIFGDRIKVGRYEDQPDYTAEVTATFEKFRQGARKDYLVSLSSSADMNYVEAGVLDLVARLNPEPFAALEAFAARHRDYLDPTVAAFDREVQFYLAYTDFLAPLRKAGLSFCLPRVSDTAKEVVVRGTVDLALAAKLVPDQPVVANDVTLTGPERILVVTGPNQGGKTTLARTIGQLHHLARLGCPVPGTEARLMLADEIFTHFERGENLGDLRGRLEDELVRVHEILRRATADSVVILNEIFASTTLQDGVFLGARILRKLIQRDCIGVCVTFLDELSTLDAAVVSMVSMAKPDDPSVRTFKVVRRPADGLAHANAIAEKYGLSYQRVRARLAG
jgi:hypothetical protein